MQCLAAPADQQSGVLALDLKDERAILGVITNICLGHDSHSGKEVVEHLGDKLLCLSVALCGRTFVLSARAVFLFVVVLLRLFVNIFGNRRLRVIFSVCGRFLRPRTP